MSDFDWEYIRERFEEGAGYAEISRELGGRPTRQAIHEKANKEGWRRLEELDIEFHRIPEHLLDPLTAEQEQVVNRLAKGDTQKVAAGLVGVAESTVSRWKKDSEDFAKAYASAISVKTANRRARVEASRDTKDQKWLLERDPHSRGEYGPPALVQINQGNSFTWNSLGALNLGIERDNHRLSEKRIEPAVTFDADGNRLSDDSRQGDASFRLEADSQVSVRPDQE